MGDSVAEVFAGVGRESSIRAWTINDFNLEPVADKDLGTFFSGDSYIILRTYQAASALRHDIHFWLGKESSLDEQVSAAMYATQLDDFLGGGPVQYRQVQGSESPEFTQLFPRVIYRSGGRHASGFTKADSADKRPAKLLHVRAESGATCQVFEVPASVQSLNSGDSFILEDPNTKTLYMWYGSSTNIKEKMKAVEAANALRASSTLKVVVVDEGETDSADAKAFFSVLGVSDPSMVAIASADCGCAPATSAAVFEAPRMFKISQDGHSEIPAPLKREHLDTEHQYGIAVSNCVWMWTGAKAAPEAKAGAFATGTKLAQSLGMPSEALIKCIKEGYEPGLFTTYIPDWSHAMYLAALEARSKGASATSPKSIAPIDLASVVSGMLTGAESDMALAQQQASKGMAAYGVEGDLQVWLVRDNELQEVPASERGEFYGADSYVILYSYRSGSGQQCHVVYYWLGRHSSNTEQGSAALLATNKHKDKLAGKSTLVRVVQNQEPLHFVKIFQDGLIVHKGDRPDTSGAAKPDGVRLYQVKAEGVSAAHAVEVEASTQSLNSSDCFVLSSRGSAVFWQGKYSSAEEREVAAAVASRLSSPGVETVPEGQEPASFWASLGGKAEYPQFDASRITSLPTLYHVQELAGGKVRVEPHSSFSQDDLNDNDAMMLDAVGEVYVWYGKSCSASKKTRASEITERFVLEVTISGGRTSQPSVVEIESGNEPPFFTMHFPGWDAVERAPSLDVYAEKLKSLTINSES